MHPIEQLSWQQATSTISATQEALSIFVLIKLLFRDIL